MKTADFDFRISPGRPDCLAAVPVRDRSKLLILRRTVPNPSTGLLLTLRITLTAGDLLIINNTRVMPVRLIGSKPSGGRIDLILVRERCKRGLGSSL